jgi:hypothetical protein
MAYLWATVRTIAILVLGLFALLLSLLALSIVGNAFMWSFAAGCVALACSCGVLSLFGYQLERVAKTPTTKHVGTYVCLGFGAVAVLGVAAPPAGYVVVSVVPPLVNAIVDNPIARHFEMPTHIESAWLANLIFWPFVAFPCARIVFDLASRAFKHTK